MDAALVALLAVFVCGLAVFAALARKAKRHDDPAGGYISSDGSDSGGGGGGD